MRADDFVTGDSARGAGQSSLVGTETTNAVNTGLVGSATAIAKNMVIGGTELGDVDKMYQTGKSAIKGSVGAARVGSDLVKDTVDTAKTTAKAFKAGLNGEDIDLSGTKSRSGSNLAKGTKKAAKEGFRAAKRAAIKDSELEDVDNLYQEAKGLSKAAVSSTKGAVSNTRKSWKMLKRSTARIKALSRKRFTAGAGNKFNQQMYRYMRSAAYQSVSTGGGIINTAKNVLSYAYWSVRMAANGIGAILGALFGAIGVLIIPVIIIIAVICTISGGSKGENASVGSLTGDEATIAQYLIDKGVDRTHASGLVDERLVWKTLPRKKAKICPTFPFNLTGSGKNSPNRVRDGIKQSIRFFVPSPISNNVSIFSEASLSAAEKAKRPTRIVWRRLSVSTMHWEPVMELTELTETVRI